MYKKDTILEYINEIKKTENDLEFFEDNRCIGYWDNENEYERSYFYPRTINELSKDILIDKKIESFINKENISKFIYDYLDENSLMVLDKIVFIYEENNNSDIRNFLENYTGDEYSLYACDEELGLTWVEKQIIFINVKKILDSSKNIINDFYDYNDLEKLKSIFIEGLFQTIFHESRHLLYECNELIEIETKEYPQNGGLEENVEEYGNEMAYKYRYENFNTIDNKLLNDFINSEINNIEEELEI